MFSITRRTSAFFEHQQPPGADPERGMAIGPI